MRPRASGAAAPAALTWASSYFPAHWDPVVAGSGAQFRELALAYASLTEIDENGKAVPDLAESWEYNATGDQVTFHLRAEPDVQRREPVDGAAVKAGLERAKTPEELGALRRPDLDQVGRRQRARRRCVHLTQVDYQIPLLLGERVAADHQPEGGAGPGEARPERRSAPARSS